MENARRFGIEPDAVVAPHRARDARKSPRALGFAGSALFRRGEKQRQSITLNRRPSVCLETRMDGTHAFAGEVPSAGIIVSVRFAHPPESVVA